jgi:hypothetical protein
MVIANSVFLLKRSTATASPTLEGDSKGDRAAVNAPPVLVGQRAAFVGCHARLSEVLIKGANLPWHFRYSRAENAHGRRRALDLVQARAGASRLPAVAGALRGLKSGGRGTRRPTGDDGPSNLPSALLPLVSTLPRLVGGAFSAPPHGAIRFDYGFFSSSGSLATFIAIRRASSRVRRCH